MDQTEQNIATEKNGVEKKGGGWRIYRLRKLTRGEVALSLVVLVKNEAVFYGVISDLILLCFGGVGV